MHQRPSVHRANKTQIRQLLRQSRKKSGGPVQAVDHRGIKIRWRRAVKDLQIERVHMAGGARQENKDTVLSLVLGDDARLSGNVCRSAYFTHQIGSDHARADDLKKAASREMRPIEERQMRVWVPLDKLLEFLLI